MEVNQTISFPVVQPTRAWPGIHTFCTTRQGGFGAAPFDTLNLGLGAGDIDSVVLANRQLLNRSLPTAPCWLKQVHGVQVIDTDAPNVFAPNQSPPEADAAVTTCPKRVLAVLTADCLSVVLSDDRGAVLGVAHAGWKGLAAGVLEATFAMMHKKYPHGRAWRAWIGPGIGAAAFQVGADVMEAFATELRVQPSLCVADSGVPQRWRLDLAGIAVLRLHQLGVQDIELSHLCTATNPQQFFSYRRDHRTGRMATIAWLSTP